MDTSAEVSKILSSYVDGLRGLADFIEKHKERFIGKVVNIIPLHNDISRLLAEAVQKEVEGVIAEEVSSSDAPPPSASLPQADGSGG